MESTESSFSSLELFDLKNVVQNDEDDALASASSSRRSHQDERWEAMFVTDASPGMPCRHKSRRSLKLQDSKASSFNDSIASITFDPAGVDKQPTKIVARTTSCDSLPLMPRRQESGRQLICLPQPARGSTHASKSRRRGQRAAAPALPRRQASEGKSEAQQLARVRSLPVCPARCPSFNGRAGSAA